MIVVAILAVLGLSLLIRNADGPFDLFQKTRILLLQNKYVGAFFYKLLSCPLCIGFHCGWVIYLLIMVGFSIGQFLLWCFAGSAIVFIGEKLFID